MQSLRPTHTVCMCVSGRGVPTQRIVEKTYLAKLMLLIDQMSPWPRDENNDIVFQNFTFVFYILKLKHVIKSDFTDFSLRESLQTNIRYSNIHQNPRNCGFYFRKRSKARKTLRTYSVDNRPLNPTDDVYYGTAPRNNSVPTSKTSALEHILRDHHHGSQHSIHSTGWSVRVC